MSRSITFDLNTSTQVSSTSFYEPEFSLDFKSYLENADYLVEGRAAPRSRSQTVIFRSEGLKWWVKVTFKGEVLNSTDEPVSKKKRRKEYQDFIRLIEFSSLRLLDDTYAVLESFLVVPLEGNAPEIRHEISPGSLPFEVRQGNDTWAYGKLLSEIISHIGVNKNPLLQTLDRIVAGLMTEDPRLRMTLREAISQLKAAGVDRTCSVYNKDRCN
ncbi:hypothetical protein FE257_007028 [Aspergillus nanangensis]|uniref:Protein kinase domain-containing protein n=1 Tax=Aspergillus nanangensis TaxID=2582783 RepID=A0AAD4GUH1_ASPNN|nr:hypothetical protein FE257_007028 [Aspergillus nanangensis]